MRRDDFAIIAALATLAVVVAVFVLADGRSFLMPGRLSSAHGAITDCKACHTKSGSGKLAWINGLVAGDKRADSEACLGCHRMPDTALNAHGASAASLNDSTTRLKEIAGRLPAPHALRAQGAAFPSASLMARGLTCATCHQEHQGAGAKLAKLSNEQCQSCHVAKFDAFDGRHPKFENYPFSRRTRIVYDHAGHFAKHFPETAKKDATKTIPATCSACHRTNDKHTMALAPFEQTCSGCHLGQIGGKERASGPKGIAFLAAPGLDLASLRKRNAAIGEWPEDADAALTPFLRLLLARNERGRALVAKVGTLDLQDLASASDADIKAVTELVWEIKRLLFSLLSGKGADVIAGLEPKVDASLAAELTASIPRDVVVAAQQSWLPNLAAEIADGPGAKTARAPAPPPEATAPPPAEAPPPPATAAASEADGNKAAAEDAAAAEQGVKAAPTKRDPPACVVRLFGQCLLEKPDDKAPGKDTTGAIDGGGGAARASAARIPPAAMGAGLAEIAQKQRLAQASGAPKQNAGPPPAAAPPRPAAGAQRDDLLYPTEEEQREINAHHKQSGKTSHRDQPRPGTPPSSSSPAAATNAQDAPSAAFIDGVDAESWAEHGGWYQKDHAIYYRPAAHEDRFIRAWLTLTGPQAADGATTPAASVFDSLTGKDAQGSCTKCHSVDAVPGGGRLVNFSQLTTAMKQGRFTRFVHEPHFGTVGDRGCLACHELGKDRAVLKSYEQRDPLVFAAPFAPVKKETCKACHTRNVARQDCLLCHKYHVHEAVTPVTETKNPTAAK